MSVSVVIINAAILAAFCNATRTDLGRIGNTSFKHVNEAFLMGIIANVSAFVLDFCDDDGVFLSGVLRDLTQRIFECPTNNRETNFFRRITEFE